MASLLFIQSELPDEVMTDEVFRVVARGQPFRNFSSYSTLQFFTINVNLLFRTSKYLGVEQVIHPPSSPPLPPPPTNVFRAVRVN